MAADIDQIRTRDPSAEESPEARVARVDISDLPATAVEEFVSGRTGTPYYVERRAGTTYLVAEDRAQQA
ncbi:MAG: hypothetical protein ABEJ23_09175 [Haloarculaceae archaeon]